MTLFFKLGIMKKLIIISSLIAISGCAWFNSSSTTSNQPQNIAPQPVTQTTPVSKADSLTANVSDETVVTPLKDTPVRMNSVTTSSAPVSQKSLMPTATPSSNGNYPALAARVKTDVNGRHYIIVEKGDTLYNLAKRSNQTPSQLITLNNITANDIQIGRKIYLD